MRVTQVCFRQHIGRMFKRHWVVQGRKIPIESGNAKELEKMNINVLDALEYVSTRPKPKPIPVQDKSGVKTFPRKSNLNCSTEYLIEGLNQASNITKTVVVDGMPQNIRNLIETISIPRPIHDAVQQTILRDQLFEFRPFKCPPSPMLLPRLVSACDQVAGTKAALNKRVTENAYFAVPVKKNGKIVRLETTINHLVLSSQSTKLGKGSPQAEMPQVAYIHPLAFDASLYQNTHEMELIYPIRSNSQKRGKSRPLWKPQIIVEKCQAHELTTYHETPVTESQLKSRALMSSFVVAASRAFAEFGATVKRLPEPIVIQSVLSAQNRFHFGIFQLNTLDLNDEGADQLTNIWYQSPGIDLYAVEDDAETGSSTGEKFKLMSYNENVLRFLVSFYVGQEEVAAGKKAN